MWWERQATDHGRSCRTLLLKVLSTVFHTGLGWSLLEVQLLWPELLHQKLGFNKIPRWLILYNKAQKELVWKMWTDGSKTRSWKIRRVSQLVFLYLFFFLSHQEWAPQTSFTLGLEPLMSAAWFRWHLSPCPPPDHWKPGCGKPG